MLYLVRKNLQYGADEWVALPWWQRRMYLEEMAEDSNEDRDGVSSSEDAGAQDLSSMSSMGVQVGTQ